MTINDLLSKVVAARARSPLGGNAAVMIRVETDPPVLDLPLYQVSLAVDGTLYIVARPAR